MLCAGVAHGVCSHARWAAVACAWDWVWVLGCASACVYRAVQHTHVLIRVFARMLLAQAPAT